MNKLMNNQKTSIIWNITRLCSWKCSFCCVNASFVKDLSQVNHEKDIHYAHGEELNFKQKIAILDQLVPGKYKIDFSGGELLIDPLNVELVLYASKILGAENVGISTSGLFVTDEVIEKLSGNINDVELTLDYVPFTPYKTRPAGYHEYAAHTIKKLVSCGIEVGVQTVITRNNIAKEKMKKIYDWLIQEKVNSWSLLRFFPSGRGNKYNDITPTSAEYCEVVDHIKEISRDSDLTVNFQYLLPNHTGHTDKCRAVKKSVGILPDGSVTACFWALDKKMQTTDDTFHLGKLPDDNIEDILFGHKAQYWREHDHKCKIFDFNTL